MFTKPIARTVLLLFLFIPLTAFAENKFKRIFIFGDSLSDTGNFAAIVGEFPDPPFFGGSRVSNGPLVSELIAAGLGLSAEPSLHLGGPAVGTNYAVATADAAGADPFNLLSQVALFLANTGGVAPRDALYMLQIGGNDVRKARDAPNLSASLAALSEGVRAEFATIRALAAAGARRFILFNVPDIGQSPETRRLATERGDSKLPRRATRFTRLYNRALAKQARRLARKLDITIRQFNTFEASRRVIANAEQLGFTNTQDACLDSAFMPRPDCNFDTFVFFDEIHPTARVHEIIVREVLKSLPRGIGLQASMKH